MTKTQVSKYATQPLYNGDLRSRCKFCNIEIRQDRLEAHTKQCEITCFNFLHNIVNRKIDSKPFTNETEIMLFHKIGEPTKWKPMNKVNVYKSVLKFTEPTLRELIKEEDK